MYIQNLVAMFLKSKFWSQIEQILIGRVGNTDSSLHLVFNYLGSLWKHIRPTSLEMKFHSSTTIPTRRSSKQTLSSWEEAVTTDVLPDNFRINTACFRGSVIIHKFPNEWLKRSLQKFAKFREINFSWIHSRISTTWQCGNYGNSLSRIFGKTFVKTAVLLNKSLKSWFDENFEGYRMNLSGCLLNKKEWVGPKFWFYALKDFKSII